MGKRRKKKRGKKKRSINKLKGFNRHHIVPRARGGLDEEKNMCRTQKAAHAFFHQYTDMTIMTYPDDPDSRQTMILPRTPDEVIEWLVSTFWKNQWEWVIKALENNKGGKYELPEM